MLRMNTSRAGSSLFCCADGCLCPLSRQSLTQPGSVSLIFGCMHGLCGACAVERCLHCLPLPPSCPSCQHTFKNDKREGKGVMKIWRARKVRARTANKGAPVEIVVAEDMFGCSNSTSSRKAVSSGVLSMGFSVTENNGRYKYFWGELNKTTSPGFRNQSIPDEVVHSKVDELNATGERLIVALCGYVNVFVIQPEARRGATLDALLGGATITDIYNTANRDLSLTMRMMRALCNGCDLAAPKRYVKDTPASEFKDMAAPDKSKLLMPFVAKEIILKRVNPNKGRVDGGVQGMFGELLRANGVTSTAVHEALNLMGVSTVKGGGDYAASARAALLHEAEMLKESDRLSNAMGIGLYYDNANFKSFHQGLKNNTSTGKNFVFCSWQFVDPDLVNKLFNRGLSQTRRKWSDISSTSHQSPNDLLLEPEDQEILDKQQLCRGNAFLLW